MLQIKKVFIVVKKQAGVKKVLTFQPILRYIFTYIFSPEFLSYSVSSVADCLNLCVCMHAYISIAYR